jgi:hypothetical protein
MPPARGSGGRLQIAAVSNAIEDSTGGGSLLGLVAEEGVLQRDVVVGGIEPHGLTEIVTGLLGFANLQ